MAKKEKFYVTTPIYYVNGKPHIGSVYTTLAADIIARWNKFKGKDVFFLTGTDEHGKKIQEEADKQNKTPKEFTDEIAAEFESMFKKLDFSNNNFVRTTDDYHVKEVLNVLQKLYDDDLIYKGEYESHYCIGCEQYLKSSDLIEGKCPLHDREPELKKEEAYLLRLSKFQDRLLEAIKSKEMQILPKKRENEMVSFIKEGLQDISISRKKDDVDWGIALPFDDEHTCYVWVDAFWNYISGLKDQKEFWPADVQLMANDILRVHATIWPALVLAMGLPLPKKLFIHGYFTLNGKKMSKSLGNYVDPQVLLNKYSKDTIRYFLMRNIAFGDDGDFSEASMVERHNNELANKLGNLVSRASSLAEKNGVEKCENKILKKFRIDEVEKLFEEYKLDKVLAKVFSFIDVLNEYVQNKKPWETKDKKVLYEVCDSLKFISDYLEPFIPETAQKIKKVFSAKEIKKSTILFQKMDALADQQINKEEEIDEVMANVAKLEYKDWEKADLRVAQIKLVEEIDGADKLFKITLDAGELGERIVCAGIKEYYEAKDLTGKKVAYLSNLAPRKMRGIESCGMLLAAFTADDSNVSLLTFDKDMENGSQIG